MILILCLDDNNGMMFNKRRQSRDQLLRAHILELTADSTLWMNEYSAKLFDKDTSNIKVDSAFLELAQEGEYCFVENVDVTAFEEKAERIILYKWNRDYPDDFRFTLPLEELGWTLTETTDFAGFSHETITEEIYEKNVPFGENLPTNETEDAEDTTEVYNENDEECNTENIEME